ncbi:beta-1,3-galactosyltransferase 2-like [Chanos chanos]|uniref:Hexosyltransferase n=1 Tax=Chanos chanos TaxID=29144 RepID=A0A6J2W3C9_CHACN|nr:beta-1,3-galactosyltransferase 2-like [Chanos chanos]
MQRINHSEVRTSKPTPRAITNITAITTTSKSHSVDLETHHVAYAKNYHFILDEPDMCQQRKPFLVLMVPVAPHNLAARDAIRSTWGNESVVHGKVVSVFFLLGLSGGADSEKLQEKVRLESQQHHDLLQSTFSDTYFNLTIKTMVIMDWLATRCSQASYAMKIDSDMFLNLDNLVAMLLKPGIPKENYITGTVMTNINVIRNKNSKWYVSEEMYPEPKYPTYLLGMGYVFSNDLPGKLVNVSKDVKPFNIEDAYVGACLKRLGIAPSWAPNPSQFKAYVGAKYRTEDFVNVITTILGSPQQLVNIWKGLKAYTSTASTKHG